MASRPRGVGRVRGWDNSVVDLTLTFVEATARDHDWVTKPFVDTPGFDRFWWTGQCPGPVAFASFADGGRGEVARAHIKLESRTGLAYPTWDRPEGGAIEIDLIEVRVDARGDGVGGAAVAKLVETYGAPIIALAKNDDAEKFWRKQTGWVEHPRETDPDDGPHAPKGMPLFLWDGAQD